MPHMQALTPEGLTQDAQAAFDWLRKNPRVSPDRIACVGFCMGGRTSYLANSALPLKAAISFYGGRIAPDLLPRAPQMNAPMLFFWGRARRSHSSGTDSGRDRIAARRAKKVFVNVEFSNADHGFFCDARPSYNPLAAGQAWDLCSSF